MLRAKAVYIFSMVTEQETKNTESQSQGTSREGSSFERPRNKRRTRRPQRGGDRGDNRAPEFEQRLLGIRRVTRVVSGGRRFSFSVALVIGNRAGKVGVGLGKSTDTSLAIEKAFRDAKKNLIELNLTEENSIPHDLEASYKSSWVTIRPAPGRGLVSGSSVRDVLELGGVRDVSSKLLSRSKNKINNARAALVALSEISKK
jgi:small subunit ribosomal protein S5